MDLQRRNRGVEDCIRMYVLISFEKIEPDRANFRITKTGPQTELVLLLAMQYKEVFSNDRESQLALWTIIAQTDLFFNSLVSFNFKNQMWVEI